MGITIQWQDEEGKVLAQYDGPPVGLWLVKDAPQCSVCLRFIDPWGNTTFNQSQLPPLQEELDKLLTTAAMSEWREHIRAISEFITQARGHVHTYVKFLGD